MIKIIKNIYLGAFKIGSDAGSYVGSRIDKIVNIIYDCFLALGLLLLFFNFIPTGILDLFNIFIISVIFHASIILYAHFRENIENFDN